MSFVKIHATILRSSIWSEPHATRIVWVTMLALADENGVVEASVQGLARTANVTVTECNAALVTLLAPDPDSRDGTSGERIEKVPGGWFILKHAEYRDKRTSAQIATAERVARHRAKRQALHVTGVTPRNGFPPSEAEAEAEADKNKSDASHPPAAVRPPRKKRQPKPRPEGPPPLSSNPAIAAFQSAYQERHGSLPTMRYSLAGDELAEIEHTKGIGPEQLRAAADAYMANGDKWTEGHPFNLFVKHFDRWHEAARANGHRQTGELWNPEPRFIV